MVEPTIHEIPVDLHSVQSAIATIGNSFIVLERQLDPFELRSSAQSYRPTGETADEPNDIQNDIL